MLYFKSCLRCKDGTVELGSDNFGTFLNCLTCGYTINSRSIRANGSIEKPLTLEDDIVKVPGMVPVSEIENPVGSTGEANGDRAITEFESDTDFNIFEDELEKLEIEEEAAAM
jgi:hypothetical protein